MHEKNIKSKNLQKYIDYSSTINIISSRRPQNNLPKIFDKAQKKVIIMYKHFKYFYLFIIHP